MGRLSRDRRVKKEKGYRRARKLDFKLPQLDSSVFTLFEGVPYRAVLKYIGKVVFGGILALWSSSGVCY